MESVNILITMRFEDDLVERLRSLSPRLNIVKHEARAADEIEHLMGEIDVLYTWQAIPTVEQAPRLQWVQLHSAGIDPILDYPLYTQSDVIFTNTSGIHVTPMAEYTMAHVLAFAHRLPTMIADTADQHWPQDRWERYLPLELRDSTIGIVGYGSIGREIARLAHAFGMTVLATKRNLRVLSDEDNYTIPGTGDPTGDIPDRLYPVSALNGMLQECDYVVVTVPLTDETYHLIGAAELESMKETAVLINIARGSVVAEEALIDALERERIGGAALDVFEEEPLPEDSPLWTAPNVIISPHISGSTRYYNARAAELFAQNLRRFLDDQPLLNQVNRDVNY